MAISFDSALGVHTDALNFRVQRTKVLASNLANVDTPGYLAKDLSFTTVMDQHSSGRISQPRARFEVQTQYAVPYQNSKDGNTVELSVEQAKFTKNNMDFQTSLTFLNMKFNGLAKAIEGR
ncbi:MULTISPECIES: flagellar basal body rod protein FlgB [Vibrio]|uniref:flagellar basal body rod protein FlgB n=1 Tax=Vibrio TaxID=662 RepID=UPI000C164167|nr:MULTISPECIES: flagellar basal body rod protein FlgB [Vibrio]NAW70651.1 flagellar basal body rod protein FlgB [Vibrio sp. V28_P6S34P95]NAX05080.1 flagellar basal body rod protein FlgB [Vibrio sp. V30_P3S12P165]NAX35537.1 flagellar basal body rod protein FlgB [Vibrio sp. V29_P1S30P107]NAX38942.1 flagellar basal body rod protein FlgB [Vibrio sp. V27_P1S3P104]NAX41620.1 flagellar basal body rod protein FlgB [Vibrio sp. V26_P1S5P106]